MRQRLRHLFRRRCLHVMGRGNLIVSWRGPDVLNQDGTFTEGNKIEIFGSIKCHRYRWHRGEHRE